MPSGYVLPAMIRTLLGLLLAALLIAQWDPDQDEPTDYWISNLPPGTDPATPVRIAKIRWRIEHDYRELKHGLGLDHFEGRSWRGLHHHALLTMVAFAFLQKERLNENKAAA